MKTKDSVHPYLVQLKKQAKELKKANGLATLAEAQFELAKSLGKANWPKLVLAVKQKDLHDSIVKGEQAKLKHILEETPKLAILPFEDGSSPILTAAEFDDPSMIETLHQHGAQLRQKYEGSEHTPLSWAITSWAFHAANKLVELGDKPDLFCAAGLGRVDLVRQFWKDGKLIANASQTGSSRYGKDDQRLPCPPEDLRDQISDALYIACRTSRTEVGKYLLEQGADPNFAAYAGGTCLAWAEFVRNRELCDALRAAGGSDDIKCAEFGATPKNFGILVTVGWNFPLWKVKQWLTEEPDMVNATSDWGNLIHAAVASGNLEMVRTVLEFKPDLDARNREGHTALEMAAAKGLTEIVSLLDT